jgi:hypothetical protein
VGAFAAHRVVLVDCAGDRDERLSGGVEDDRLLICFELVADDPVAGFSGIWVGSGIAAQAARLVWDARAGSLISSLAAGWRACCVLTIT